MEGKNRSPYQRTPRADQSVHLLALSLDLNLPYLSYQRRQVRITLRADILFLRLPPMKQRNFNNPGLCGDSRLDVTVLPWRHHGRFRGPSPLHDALSHSQPRLPGESSGPLSHDSSPFPPFIPCVQACASIPGKVGHCFASTVANERTVQMLPCSRKPPTHHATKSGKLSWRRGGDIKVIRKAIPTLPRSWHSRTSGLTPRRAPQQEHGPFCNCTQGLCRCGNPPLRSTTSVSSDACMHSDHCVGALSATTFSCLGKPHASVGEVPECLSRVVCKSQLQQDTMAGASFSHTWRPRCGLGDEPHRYSSDVSCCACGIRGLGRIRSCSARQSSGLAHFDIPAVHDQAAVSSNCRGSHVVYGGELAGSAFHSLSSRGP